MSLQDTWRAAYVAAQVALTAAEQLMMGRDRVAFAMCRPPGYVVDGIRIWNKCM